MKKFLLSLVSLFMLTTLALADLPLKAGMYYLYNPLSGKFLSRGNAWGTSAVVDDYGVAINVEVADQENGTYTLKGFDNNLPYGFDDWMFSDCSGGNADKARKYTLTSVEGGFTITNTNNGLPVYVYMNEADPGNVYRVAGNGTKGDNYTDDAQTVWQFKTPAERNEIVAAREAAEKTAAYTAAGLTEDDVVELGDPTELTFATGSTWEKTVFREQDGQPVTNDNGTEMWQATGNYTQTVAELPVGLYKVSIQAFYRNGGADECVERDATGYNTVLTYLEANGNKIQVKSWTTDKGEGNDPNDMGQAKSKFDAGKYLAEGYAYVGEDGILNLKVDNPAHIGNGWFIVSNVKYAQVYLDLLYADAVALAADENAVAVGKLLDAIEAYKTDRNTATLKLAMDQFQQDNADLELDVTSKVGTGTDKWVNAQSCPENEFKIITHNGIDLVQVFGVTGEGNVLTQEVEVENGLYNVALYATSHNAWDGKYGVNAAGAPTLQEDADDVAYVFASSGENSGSTWITARHNSGLLETEPELYNVNGIEVENGKISLGLALAQAAKTEWHSIQIASLKMVTTAKNAYSALAAEMQATRTVAVALLADPYKTEGHTELQAAIEVAEAAIMSNKLNVPEFEAAIAALESAINAFKKANYATFTGAYYIQAPSGKYMAAGHSWGTQGIVNETGLDLTLATLENKTVTFDSRVFNGNDRHFLGSDLYMDAPVAAWITEQVGADTYTISDGTKYIGVDENDNLVLQNEAAAWKFFEAAGIDAARKTAGLEALATATAENGVDATFLLKDPNFNRGDQRQAAWTVSEDCINSNLGDGCNGTNGNGCAESFHSVFTISQAMADAPKGVYKLTAQGFYRQDDGEEEAIPVFFIGDQTGALPVKAGEEGNMSDASVAFSSGLYTIEPIEFVFTEGEALTVGIKGTATHQWVIFDNFQLTYYGPAPAPAPTYAINIAVVENGQVEADVENAAEGATVTLTATPAEGYMVDEAHVTYGENVPVELNVNEEENTATFVMPAADVNVLITFKEVEDEEPEVKATLVHTAGTAWGSNTGKNTVDSAAEYYNRETGNGWAGAAFAEFDFSNLPNGATITEATLFWNATNLNVNDNRDNKVYYLDAGQTVDYADIQANENAHLYTGVKTFLENVVAPKGSASIEGKTMAADALNALIAAGQKTIIFQFTANAGGANLHGKAAEDAPQLVIKYLPGAPEVPNASFEADGEKAASNAALEMTGWTEVIDGSYNNTELRPAGSASTTSPYCTSNPSEGDYSLFVRHGWNGGGNAITLTSDALAEIPAGDYTLSVDYKQHYGYDEDNQQNENTKVSISLKNGEEVLGSETSPAAPGSKDDAGDASYFNDAEWSTLTASFTLDEPVAAGAKVVITLNAAGARRSDFFLDNVKFVKIPGVEAAKLELQKAIEAAQAEVAKYTVGEDLFMYPESEIAPLTTAIATATDAYNDPEATKGSVNTATETLNAFVAAFAPAINAPAADKAYVIQNNTAEGNLSINESTVTVEVGAQVFFTAVEGGFALSNAEGKYIFKTTDNTWTLATTEDINEAYVINANHVDGGYTLQGAKGLLGLDGAAAGSTVYANKTAGNHGIWTIEEYVAPTPQPVIPTLTNADFEGEYTVYASPNDDRDIYQPAGWTVTYENGDGNDMTALNSGDKAWNNFENKPQLGEAGGNNTYWVRFRWGDSESLTLSQQVNLTAGNYKLTADAFFNGADGASATISAAGQSTAITGNSTWANHKVVFTVTEEGPVTIALNVTQTKQVENIAAFDNVKLDTYDSMDEAKDELQAAITAAKAIETEGKVGVEELNAAITAAENALNDAEATEMSLVAAKDALNDAVAEFNDANITVPALAGWTRVRTADIENVADNYYVLVDANSLNYVMSNEADHYRPCYKAVADPVANPSFVWTLEGSDNTFALKSFSTGAYFIAPSNGWDTSMTGSTGSATFQFTLNNGVYSIMCEQSKGLVGHWNDSGAAVANDGENIAANKQAKDAPGFYLFAMPKATYEAAILAVRAEATAGASKETPIDITAWIQNADWSGDFGGWARSGSWGNMQWGKQTLEVWNASNVIVKQTFIGVPDGTYKLTADVIAGNDDNKVAYVFGIGGSTVNSDPVSAVASAGNYDTMSAEVAGNTLTADNIVVTGGELTVGLNIAAGWVVADNFKLYYMGEDMDQYVDAYKKALAAAQAIDQESAMRADAKAALASALLSYAEVSETDKEALLAATSALNGAAVAAQTSIDAYASAKSLLDDVDEVLANTNVYTAEAYETYTTAHATWTAKYEDGTLTDEEAASLRKDILPSRYIMGVDTWHWANTTDDFLLSAWTIDEVQAHEFDTKLYINMWSMEGYTDGSDFKVPFFEYWTGDGDSLGEATLKATISGLTAGETAEVDILVRVRAKNGVAAADATGITLQVNDGEPVDVTEGDVIGDSQFSVEKYTATGVIGEDGNLFIKLKVAAENNISWLSFKDVTYSLSTIPTAITDVKGVKNVGSIYDLSGRKVEKMVKGVYIVNGKKVSVK